MHCVCGNRETTKGTYREFVFYDEGQLYPEYTVIYRRQYDPEKVEESMRVPSKGTTGRFWQNRGDIFGFRGWKNVPVEISNKLSVMASKGTTQCEIDLGGE